MKTTYMDYSATTYVKPEVLDAMMPFFTEKFGNPSSFYGISRETKMAVDNARAQVAKAINCDPNEVYFTGGGSEADNWAIKGIATAHMKKGNHIITTKIEHHAVLHTCEFLEKFGFEVTYLDVNEEGFVDLKQLEEAITDKTKAIAVVHYAGISPDMDKVMKIAKEHNLKVVEDAAQGFMAKYKDKYLGTIGDIGCYSFHETKNYSMGEGGAVVINDPDLIERAEIIREKGTNRNKFFRGEIDKYTWVDYGSSYLPSELNCAYLYPQLDKAEEINNARLSSWNYYKKNLEELEKKGLIKIQTVPEYSAHNAHMFYIKARSLDERTSLIKYLKDNGIQAVFHYIPLHDSPAGKRFGRFNGKDEFTTIESEKLIRLPMYYGLTKQDQDEVIKRIKEFYQK